MFTPFFVLTKFIKQILPENNRRNTLRNFFVNLEYSPGSRYNEDTKAERNVSI